MNTRVQSKQVSVRAKRVAERKPRPTSEWPVRSLEQESAWKALGFGYVCFVLGLLAFLGAVFL